ncbi:hypothetical protein, partial [Paraburkholderia hospita]|uniref:hypothetical protein n=1 Tax=Paraburkholderia hospita TaxID=169430 RepID=UPI001EE6919E
DSQLKPPPPSISRLNPPYTSSDFSSIFRCLEAVGRFFSVTVLLEKPREVNGAHQFIKQMLVAMTVAACDKRQVGGQ